MLDTENIKINKIQSCSQKASIADGRQAKKIGMCNKIIIEVNRDV